MVRKDYDFEDLSKDLRFKRMVEHSPAFDYLANTFDEPSVLEEKIRLLERKGYSNLNVSGGKLPIRDCSNPRISMALSNIYEQSKKNIETYHEKSKKAVEEMDKKYVELSANVTPEQYLGALQGGWQWKNENY